jgi:acetoin utilization protein AcuB
MLVRDIMTDAVQFVAPTTSLRDVLTTFEEEEIRHLPVLSDQELVGIISDRDVRGLRKVYEAPGEPSILDSPVSDYMKTDVLSLGPDSTIVSAIDMIIHLRVGAVPVVEPGTKTLVGIVSYVDVLRTARDRF